MNAIARHSRAGGNPALRLLLELQQLDSRLRGNDEQNQQLDRSDIRLSIAAYQRGIVHSRMAVYDGQKKQGNRK